MNELESVRIKIKGGKAGGPDGLTLEKVRTAVNAVPTLILRTLNKALKAQNFPAKLKRSRVVPTYTKGHERSTERDSL